MQFPIPAWVPAVFGASLILISAIVGTILLHSLQPDMKTTLEKMDSADRELKAYWEKYREADQSRIVADLLAGIIDASVLDSDKQRSTTRRVAQYISEAICTTRRSYMEISEIINCNFGEVNFENQQPTVNHASNSITGEDALPEIRLNLQRANLEYFERSIALLGRERLSSTKKLKQLRDQKNETERYRQKLESQAQRRAVTQVSLNLLGLAIVLLKDLPIWKGNKSDPN